MSKSRNQTIWTAVLQYRKGLYLNHIFEKINKVFKFLIRLIKEIRETTKRYDNRFSDIRKMIDIIKNFMTII